MHRNYSQCPDCDGRKAKTAKRCRECHYKALKATQPLCPGGCGRRSSPRNYCAACRMNRYGSKCADCGEMIGVGASRCSECNYKFLSERRRAAKTAEAEMRRERLSDPAYLARLERNRRMLAGYLSTIPG